MPDAAPVLLVTGASGGIGAATALLAAQRGYAECVNYLRSRDSAEQVAAATRGSGGRAIAVQADVSSETEVVRLFATVDRELGPLAALVNNAAVLETQMRLDAMDAARIERIFAVNVTGSFLCAREAVRRMSTRHGGRGGNIVFFTAKIEHAGDVAIWCGSIGRLTPVAESENQHSDAGRRRFG